MNTSGSTRAAHLEPAIEQAAFGEEPQHVAAEAADRAFLDRHQHLMVLRQAADEILIERLDEPRVRHRGREAERGEFGRPP